MLESGRHGGSRHVKKSNEVKVSKLPKLTVSMKPETKARLEAYSTLAREPAWRIVDDALRKYLEAIPAEDKWAVEGMAKRIDARSGGRVRRKGAA